MGLTMMAEKPAPFVSARDGTPRGGPPRCRSSAVRRAPPKFSRPPLTRSPALRIAPPHRRASRPAMPFGAE